MKEIMISIKPKWVAKILNGEKTIEARKTCPALFKGWEKNDSLKYGCGFYVYIYCTKDKKDYLYYDKDFGDYITLSQDFGKLNGKVVAKFTLNKVEEIRPKVKLGLLNTYNTYETETLVINPLLEKCCLSYEELDLYLKWKIGYAWHIDNLVIFDKPKELNEFEKVGSYNNPTIKCKKKEQGRCNCGKSPFTGEWVGCEKARLTKAPQSWCYIESEE